MNILCLGIALTGAMGAALIYAIVRVGTRPDTPRPDLNAEWAAINADEYVNGAS